MLVVSTGIMLRSFKALVDQDPGFRQENVLSMQVALPARYETTEQRALFYEQLQTRLAALHGVTDAALVNVLPMDWSDDAARVTDDARPAARESEQPIVRLRAISDGYFSTMRIPLLRGRGFDSRDRSGAQPVAIVSERFARQLWPSGDALGHRVRLSGDTIWREVVGVSADIRHNPNVGLAIQPTIHLPVRQHAPARMAIVLRTAGSAGPLGSTAQREIAALDPALAAGDVRLLERVIHNALAPQRTTAGMLGVFGVVALILACVGVYGVMSYSVARRAAEIGVRLAFGARRPDVLAMVMRYGATLTAIGVLIGVAGAWALSRSMRSLMHDVAGTDLFTFAAGTLFLSAMAMLACYLPARRAAATDPTVLLRQE
jgi:putative ABC transport system permease protein